MAETSTNLARIWRETINRLEALESAVREAKRLEEALDFTRYVLWSGLITLCDENPQSFPLKVDGPFLRWKCNELQRMVQERYRLNDGKPHIEETQLSAINRKLDIIAGRLRGFSCENARARAACPGVSLIEG